MSGLDTGRWLAVRETNRKTTLSLGGATHSGNDLEDCLRSALPGLSDTSTLRSGAVVLRELLTTSSKPRRKV